MIEAFPMLYFRLDYDEADCGLTGSLYANGKWIGENHLSEERKSIGSME
jgi:hypothetical protein